MPIQSQKAEAIDVYIGSHDCKISKEKIEINGKIEILDSYLIPLEYLQYNHDNRRFNLEIQEYEAKNARKLDPSDLEDVKIIKDLLLQEKSEAERLYDDLKQIGEQREVGAITFDGIVINGNRRMATIEKLHLNEPTGKWSKLWVVRLPKDISEKDLWKIEAGLQLSKEKVADYGPVNNLLMIREGKKAGLNESEIAASMYGWNEKQVISDLERLDLIDTFLLFMGQKNNYGLIKKFRLHEHFIDLQKGLVQKLKESGIPKKEMIKKLEIAFAYLRSNITNPGILSITHYDIRNICKVLQDFDTTATLTESFKNYDSILNIPANVLKDNLDNAFDLKKNKEDKQKPGKLIDKALTALNSIDRKNDHYKKDQDVKIKLKKIYLLIKEMKKELGVE